MRSLAAAPRERGNPVPPPGSPLRETYVQGPAAKRRGTVMRAGQLAGRGVVALLQFFNRFRLAGSPASNISRHLQGLRRLSAARGSPNLMANHAKMGCAWDIHYTNAISNPPFSAQTLKPAQRATPTWKGPLMLFTFGFKEKSGARARALGVVPRSDPAT